MINIPEFEDSYTEFKLDSVRNDEIAKEICALSNTEGGRIFFGLDDHGKIQGVENPQELEQRVCQLCSTTIQPAVIPIIEITRVEKKHVLIVHINNGPQKPYAVKQQNRFTYFIRSGSTSREATREELIRLTQAVGFLHFEIMGVDRTSILDLDPRIIEDYFYRIRKLQKSEDQDQLFWQELLLNTDYLTNDQNAQTPLASYAGLLLFGKDPRRYLSSSGISAIKFAGSEMEYDSQHRDTIKGPIVSLYDDFGLPRELGLIDKALLFCQQFLSSEKLIGAARKRIWDIPETVLRETLVNAVLHRDYTIARDIDLKIFSDRVEISNPGKLPNTVSIAKMKAGCRYPRNPILIETARDYGFIEHLGMGVPRKIIKGMLEFNGKEPEIIETEDQLTIILSK